MEEITDKQAEEASEKGYRLIDNYDIIDDIPPPFKKVNEDRIEVINFLDKLPEGKVFRIKFPNEYLWKSYHTALRYYASDYSHDMQFNKRKDEGGYFIYIKKLKRIENEESMEIKSI